MARTASGLEPTTALPAAAERFDEAVEQAAEYRSAYRSRLVAAGIGGLVVVGAVADYLYIRGQTGLELEQEAVPWILLALGIAFIAIGLGTIRADDPVASVTVGDGAIEVVTRRGKVNEFAWADPKLVLSLSHGVPEGASAEVERAKGWILTASGAGGHVWTTIGPRAGAALEARARRLGWFVTRDSTPWTGKYGDRHVTVDVVFSRTRPDD